MYPNSTVRTLFYQNITITFVAFVYSPFNPPLPPE